MREFSRKCMMIHREVLGLRWWDYERMELLTTWNNTQLFPEGEVNSGGYIPRREASRYISTALHRSWGIAVLEFVKSDGLKNASSISSSETFAKRRAIFLSVRKTTRWSGDVNRRMAWKIFNAVSHNRARPYFRIQHGRGEVRARWVYLNVHSVKGNVVDKEWSVEFWGWKCCREFGNT